MAEYIEREALIREIISDMTLFIGDSDAVQKHDEQCNYAISCIEDAPTADVIPVVHGQWERYSTSMMSCSICRKHTARHQFNYCPNCGAKMCGCADKGAGR